MTSSVLSPDNYNIMPQVNAAAAANNIPAPIYQALIQKESSYNPFLYNSNKSADGSIKTFDYGPAQINSATAQSLGINQYDTTTNINTGAQILAQNYAKTGNWADALSMYNTGQTAANSSTGSSYANTVLGWAQQLGYNPSTTPASSTAPSSLTTPIPLTPDSIQRSKDALNSNPLTAALLKAIDNATTWVNQHMIIVGLVGVGAFLIFEGVATGFNTPNTTQIIDRTVSSVKKASGATRVAAEAALA